jgi:hypothetical protein
MGAARFCSWTFLARLIKTSPGRCQSSLSFRQLTRTLHKFAFGTTFSSINKVYSRRSKNKEKQAPQLVAKALIAKKKVSKCLSELRALGVGHAPTPATTDGLRRSPRLQSLMDGHKQPASAADRQTKRPSKLSSSSMHTASKGNILSLFPGPVKFPTLTELDQTEGPYPVIPTEMLQERARLCGVPREEVTPELLQSKATEEGQKEGSSAHGNPQIPNEV